MKKKQLVEDFVRRYAVVFLHSEGWTISGIFARRLDADVEKLRQSTQLPNFKYKVVKLNPITFEV